MRTKHPIVPILDFDFHSPVVTLPSSLVEYCMELEKSIDALSDAIELRRKYRETRKTPKEKD